MPYITAKRRAILNELHAAPETAGELNYLVTSLCRQYLERLGNNYTTLNEIIGALECAKLEFYRRVLIPYENQKRDENGDVY